MQYGGIGNSVSGGSRCDAGLSKSKLIQPVTKVNG